MKVALDAPLRLVCEVLLLTSFSVTLGFAQGAESMTNQTTSTPVHPVAAVSSGIPGNILTTVAGNGLDGNYGNGGLATSAEFSAPTAVVSDSSGNLYIVAPTSNVVRVVNAATGIVSNFAGDGFGGYSGDGGSALKARLYMPNTLAIDSSGNLFIGDYGNNVIRRVDAKSGDISTVAGNGFTSSSITGAPECGALTTGVLATTAPICYPLAIAVDPSDNLYISDTFNVIHKVDAKSRIMTTYAGNGFLGYYGDGGLAINAQFNSVKGMAFDKAGNLFLSDTFNCIVRRIDARSTVITHVVSAPNQGCTIAGDGGPATSANIYNPQGIAIDPSGNVFFADSGNSLIRVLDAANNNIYTVAGRYDSEPPYDYALAGDLGDGGPASGALLGGPNGVALDSAGNLYFADSPNNIIRKVSSASSVLPLTAPVISPLIGQIATPTTFSIAPATPGETIRYTIDGAVPTTISPVYSAPIQVSNTTILQAFAPGTPNSDAAVAVIFFNPVPVISVPTGFVPSGTLVSISDANAHASIYYTTDGSYPVNMGPTVKRYTGPFTLTSNTGYAVVNAAIWTATKDLNGKEIGIWSNDANTNYTLTQGLVATTVAASGIARTTATLNGTLALPGSSGTQSQYWFVWGPSSKPEAFVTAKLPITVTSAAQTVHLAIGGLSPSTSYSFRVLVSDSTPTVAKVSGNTLTFTTPAN